MENNRVTLNLFVQFLAFYIDRAGKVDTTGKKYERLSDFNKVFSVLTRENKERLRYNKISLFYVEAAVTA